MISISIHHNRLIVGEAIGKKRVLTDTTVFEELRQLRNKAIDAEIRKSMAPTDTSKDNLGLDEADAPVPTKKRKSLQESLPAIIEVVVPRGADAGGIPMRMLNSGPTEPVTVELSPENLNWMRWAITRQLEAEATEPSTHGASSSAGVHWVESKKAWRVKYTDEDGKTRWKHWKAVGDEAEVQQAKADASAFLASLGE